MPTSGRTIQKNQRKAEVLERQKQALALRINDKLTLREIGERLGVTEQTAMRYVNGALAKLAQDTQLSAQKYRALQTLRLERLLDAWETNALSAKDDKAAAVYLRIVDQLSKLYGLYPQGDTAAQGNTTINVVYASDNRQITLSDNKAGALPRASVIALPGDNNEDSA